MLAETRLYQTLFVAVYISLMKMDFPHLADTNPAERSRARYAALVACAANGQLRHSWQTEEPGAAASVRDRFNGLDARIGFFGSWPSRSKNPAYGAFLPVREESPLTDQEAETAVNLAASAIGKPNFLGSRYPGHPETLRGMEN